MYLKLGPFEFAAKDNRPARTVDDWQYVTVTRQDELSSARSGMAYNPVVAAFMHRMRGQVMTCVRGNARAAADIPVKLYRRTPKTGSKRGTKAVGREVRKYLASGAAGTKAATWAETDAGIVEVTHHPVLDILNKPNPHDVGGEFWELQYMLKSIAGHSFEWYDTDEHGVVAVYTLLPQHVNVLRDADDFVYGFSYGREGGRVRDFSIDDTRMYKNRLNPFDPFAGLSDLHGLLEEVDLAQSNIDFDLEFVKHGQVPPFVVSLPENATDDHVKDTKAQMRNDLGGLRGKLRGWVLREAEVTVPNITPRELQSQEKQEAILQRIRQRFGWSESMHDSNASTRAAALVGFSEQYLGQTIRPMVNRDAEQRTEGMLPLFGLEPGEWFLAADDPVGTNVEAEENATRLDVAAGVISINEARQARGLEPVGDGDALRINGVPLDVLANPPQMAPGLPPVTFQGPSVSVPVTDRRTLDADEPATVLDGEGRDMAGSATKAESFARFANDPENTSDCCEGHGTKDLPTPQWIDEATEAELRPLLTGYLQDLRDEVIQAGGSPSAVTVSQMRDQLERELRPILATTLLESATRALDDIGLEATADDFSPTFATEFLDTHVPQLSGDVTQSQVEAVREAVARGVDEGRTIDEIAKEIREADFEPDRAERIARTETQIAQNQGTLEGYREGGVDRKGWVLAPGNCPLCGALKARLDANGGGIPIDEKFARAGEVLGGQKVPWDVFRPPAHPNCRCVLEAVLEDE